ncbi:MAG: FAD-dependent oxidoreductase [Actinomycetota bacterium]|nr:FAD-dependent oxidoreductase [Actinomycetota bacterium]
MTLGLDPTMARQRVVVVGGGILGTLHAYLALERGAEVVHLERDLVPMGASVRNFGLVWVSGRAEGRETEMALRARELWETIARDVPDIKFRANGSFTLVNDERELEVAQRALQRPGAILRGFDLMNRAQVLMRNPVLRGEFIAGLYCERDAAVESRLALSALRHAMISTGRYTYLAGRELVGVRDGAVIDHRGEVHAGDRVFLCLGASLSGFARELFESEPVRSVRLQMAETEPLADTLTTAIANADSFRYYPQFRADALELLTEQEATAAHYAVQLLVQQRCHGGLTIGDTHEGDRPGIFDAPDRPMDIIVASARRLIGPAMPRIERRWTGVYHQMDPTRSDEVYLRREIVSGVTIITGAGGRGMTLAPAIAEESFT